MKGKARECDVESVRGLIKKLSYEAWKRLPRYAKVYIDIDDLIQESCCNLYCKRRCFDPSRGAWTTFAHHVIESHLQVYLSALKTQMRRPVEIKNEPVCKELASTVFEALETYELIYRRAGKNLRALLAVWVGVPEGYAIPSETYRRFSCEQRNLWRLRYELEAIAGSLKLSFQPRHVEVLWQSGRLQNCWEA